MKSSQKYASLPLPTNPIETDSSFPSNYPFFNRHVTDGQTTLSRKGLRINLNPILQDTNNWSRRISKKVAQQQKERAFLIPLLTQGIFISYFFQFSHSTTNWARKKMEKFIHRSVFGFGIFRITNIFHSWKLFKR